MSVGETLCVVRTRRDVVVVTEGEKCLKHEPLPRGTQALAGLPLSHYHALGRNVSMQLPNMAVPQIETIHIVVFQYGRP